MSDNGDLETASNPLSREEKRDFQEKMSRWKALMRKEEDQRKITVSATGPADDKVA